MATGRETYDLVIVGSGAACVPAALQMRARGKTALIVEKRRLIGGTSAMSGGVIWIPDNQYLEAAGGGDSPERARAYIDAVVGDVGPASSDVRRDAFIRHGREMVSFLTDKGMRFIHANWPDYYDTAPGGLATGRSLAAPVFDINALGRFADRLASHPITRALPIASSDAVHLNVMKGHAKGKRVMAGAVGRIIANKLFRRQVYGGGNALQGRLLQIALAEGVPIWPDTPMRDFIVEDGRVVGIVAERDGAAIEIGAREGVLLNAGGFARNLRMRERWQPKPTSVDWTSANDGDTGEVMEAAIALGAAFDLMDEAVWGASSFNPDGSLFCFHSPTDIGKPHCITVDREGRRFADENLGYMEYGQRMYAAGAVPAWAIFDAQHRKNYTWGLIPPGLAAAGKYVRSGYLKRAGTIEELARQCGLPPATLAETVTRFNGFARDGVDRDFHRGESAYARYYGDSKVKPNPVLGTIERGPFYAVKLQPGDFGTMGGLLTDEHARVLREDGKPIPGLYATGNTTASVMGRHYLGAGATIGPSMVFGYIAARHASGAN